MLADGDILKFAENMRCEELHMMTDHATGLKGIVAIHSTKLGPALGGCRWLNYPSAAAASVDAIRLAQGMSYKSAISNLPLGGGKAVMLIPEGKVDRIACFRAFGRFLNKLNGRYITAVDAGTSIADMDVIAEESKHVTSTSHSVYTNPDPSRLTALGVEQGIKAMVKFKLQRDSLAGVKIAVQGLGHVGYNLVKLLVEEKALVTVYDIKPKLIENCKNDFNVATVDNLDKLLNLDCDVFSPCALGAVLNKKNISKLKTKIIAGAANNQLEEEIDAQRLRERGILYAPDFVISAGGIIYVAGQHIKHSEQETREKILQIGDNLTQICKRADKEKSTTYKIAHDIAIERIYK